MLHGDSIQTITNLVYILQMIVWRVPVQTPSATWRLNTNYYKPSLYIIDDGMESTSTDC